MEHFTGTAGTHPVVACAREVSAAVKGVADVDPVFMGTSEKRAALVELAAARDLVEALWLRVVAVSDDVAEVAGARDVAAWLAASTRADRGVARAAQGLSAGLGTWQQTSSALMDGTVTVPQARVIVRSLEAIADADREVRSSGGTGLDPETLQAAEARLVELAGDHAPAELARLGRRILQIVAPHVADEVDRKALADEERRASASTRLTLRKRHDGSTELRARIPDHVAGRLRTYLDAWTSPRTSSHGADDLAGGSGLGFVEESTGERLPVARLRGEAFCALLEAADPGRMPLHGGAATTVVVTVGLDDLMSGVGAATTGEGTRITAGQARRLACGAGIVPLVLGGRSQPLDLGRTRRLFSKAQRLALAHRHPACRADGCTVPATWCEAHHREPWSKGGRTDLKDGMLLCSWHHHRIHDDRYLVKELANGDVRFHRRT